MKFNCRDRLPPIFTVCNGRQLWPPAKAAKMCAALEGKQFHELVSAGLASLSASGPAAAAGGAAGGAAAAKVEEVVEEPEEEVDMGGLFGGGDDDY